MRKVFNLEDIITIDHLDKMNKIMLVTGMMVGYAYSCEFFIAWYSGNPYERFAFINRAFGPYWWAYWIMITCNVVVPQIFWFKKYRRNIAVMFVASLLGQCRDVVRALRDRDHPDARFPADAVGRIYTPTIWD